MLIIQGTLNVANIMKIMLFKIIADRNIMIFTILPNLCIQRTFSLELFLYNKNKKSANKEKNSIYANILLKNILYI